MKPVPKPDEPARREDIDVSENKGYIVSLGGTGFSQVNVVDAVLRDKGALDRFALILIEGLTETAAGLEGDARRDLEAVRDALLWSRCEPLENLPGGVETFEHLVAFFKNRNA